MVDTARQGMVDTARQGISTQPEEVDAARMVDTARQGMVDTARRRSPPARHAPPRGRRRRHRGGRGRRGAFSPGIRPPSPGSPPLLHRHRTGGRLSCPRTRPSPWPRFAPKEAVMKALGTGLGGLALTEVEVRSRRRSGCDRGRAGARPASHGRRVGGPLSGRAVDLSLARTAGVAAAFVVAERSCRALCPDGGRNAAADARRSPRSATRPWSAGPDRRRRCRPAPPRRRVRATGDRGRRQGQQRRGRPRRRRALSPAPRAGHRHRRRGRPRRAGALRSGDRRRLRHGVPRLLRRARSAPGVPVLSVDIASGVDADTGAAPGAPFPPPAR